MQVCRIVFKKVGKKYFFDPNKLDIKAGDIVVVETIRGLELGFVVGDLIDIDDTNLDIKPILRHATEKDLANYEQNKLDALEATKITIAEVKNLKLDMKVLEAEYTLDHSKLIIYFESEGRIDFRELVRTLAEIFHLRIELRQVGSRDGTKVFGGIGPCGLTLCCNSFLSEFETITVKMAKNQNLALNPSKISGNCSKLLCCIAYEDEQYKKLRKNFPNPGDIIEAPEGEAKVLTSDPLNRTLKVKYLNEPDKFGFLTAEDIKKPKDLENGDN